MNDNGFQQTAEEVIINFVIDYMIAYNVTVDDVITIINNNRDVLEDDN